MISKKFFTRRVHQYQPPSGVRGVEAPPRVRPIESQQFAKQDATKSSSPLPSQTSSSETPHEGLDHVWYTQDDQHRMRLRWQPLERRRIFQDLNQKILIAWDGSQAAQKALQFAKDWALATGSSLLIVTILFGSHEIKEHKNDEMRLTSFLKEVSYEIQTLQKPDMPKPLQALEIVEALWQVTQEHDVRFLVFGKKASGQKASIQNPVASLWLENSLWPAVFVKETDQWDSHFSRFLIADDGTVFSRGSLVQALDWVEHLTARLFVFHVHDVSQSASKPVSSPFQRIVLNRSYDHHSESETVSQALSEFSQSEKIDLIFMRHHYDESSTIPHSLSVLSCSPCPVWVSF